MAGDQGGEEFVIVFDGADTSAHAIERRFRSPPEMPRSPPLDVAGLAADPGAAVREFPAVRSAEAARESDWILAHVEATAAEALIGLGLTDAFRLFEQEERSFSWWDYRMMAFRRNFGLRIDHILLSAELAARCTACGVDKAPRKLERPSDHAPVVTEIAD